MHDRNGTPLKVGDRVIVEATITSVEADSDYCNVSLRTTAPLRADHMRNITTNAGNCALVESLPDPKDV